MSRTVVKQTNESYYRQVPILYYSKTSDYQDWNVSICLINDELRVLCVVRSKYINKAFINRAKTLMIVTPQMNISIKRVLTDQCKTGLRETT
jgi:hypothetical protein